MPPELLAVADCVTIATPAGGLQLLVHLLLPHRQNGRPIEKIFFNFPLKKKVHTYRRDSTGRSLAGRFGVGR
jgi:hypothetical protein